MFPSISISVVAADISEGALEVARNNVRRNKANVVVVKSDLFEKIDGIFSMIMSNPPYIRSTEISSLQDEVRLYDPVEALDGKEDGLYFYRKIINESPNYLEDGGWLLFEIGYDQAEDVTELMEARGFEEISVKKDLAGLDRVVYGRYIK